MKKSANEVMEEILFSAAIDAIVALKAGSKGLPNNLLRDIGAIHANTAFPDLPADLRAAVSASVRGAFARLLKEGYSVAPSEEVRAQRPPRPQGERPQGPRGGRPPAGPPRGPRGPRRGGDRPPRKPTR
jgi:hypothetical protein